ncbi:MAG TPA: cytochrome b N-terminal domain-containing protein [Gemmatimonadales bacterium]|nr:cytochrome b N-terminal domain-containing protein [Gemmatimonadales bacterium]
MGLTRWLDERLDLAGIRRGLLDREVPDRLTWWHTLGSATLTVFLIQVITGIVLATYYAPSPDHAYESIRFVDRQVASGSLLRAIHHWGASAMVVLIIAHVVRVFSVGAYKYPREANWLVGVVLLLVVLGFSFTGYLLPWDQKAYWATAVGTNIGGTTPVVGGYVVTLLRGGAELGAATLTRFYAFHVLWLPMVLGVFVLVHLAVVIRQGIAPLPATLEQGAPARTTDPRYPAYYRAAYAGSKRRGVRFWPDIIGKDAAVSLAVVLVIVLLALALGAPLEAPADPSDTAYVPRPEWYFLPLYQLLKLVPGSLESLVAFGVPTALIVTLLALPFFDTRSKRNLLRRPVALVGLVVILGGSGLLIGAAVRQAGPAVPPEVGRPLTSRERAGRALFQSEQCTGCHTVAGKGGNQGPDLSDIGLHHSAAWLHSYVEDPSRFHPGTKMPSFGPPTLSHEEIEELAQYLSSLRGPPGKRAEPQYADTFPEAPKP